MNTYLMLGKYSTNGMHEISGKRTQQVQGLIEGYGGKLRETYALFGEYDLVFIVEMPNMTDALKAALAVARLTNISFSTCAAMPITEFDRLAEDLKTEIASARMEAGG